MRRKIFVNVSKNSDPDAGLRKLQYATLQDFINQENDN